MYTVYMYAMFDMKYNSSFPNFVLFFVILFIIIPERPDEAGTPVQKSI